MLVPWQPLLVGFNVGPQSCRWASIRDRGLQCTLQSLLIVRTVLYDYTACTSRGRPMGKYWIKNIFRSTSHRRFEYAIKVEARMMKSSSLHFSSLMLQLLLV